VPNSLKYLRGEKTLRLKIKKRRFCKICGKRFEATSLKDLHYCASCMKLDISELRVIIAELTDELKP